MRGVLLLAALAFTTSCALRLPTPVVRQWQALLVDRDGFSVVHRAIVTELHAFVTWRTACEGGIRAVAMTECNEITTHRRVFELIATDAKQRTALYREVR